MLLPFYAHTGSNIGALIIRIGFWGPVYYNHNKEPHKSTSIGNYLRPYSSLPGAMILNVQLKPTNSCLLVCVLAKKQLYLCTVLLHGVANCRGTYLRASGDPWIEPRKLMCGLGAKLKNFGSWGSGCADWKMFCFRFGFCLALCLGSPTTQILKPKSGGVSAAVPARCPS